MKQLTLQEQYNLIQEGRGNKAAFMKSALSQFPNLFNNFTEFNTAVGVLKQKQIISEGIGGVVTSGNPFINWKEFLAEEAKAEEKEPTKEVVDMETAGYDYKDEKNIDNLYGEAFLQGYYAEMKDPKNAEKSVDELKEIVAKNMAKDKNYYMKEAAFGVKGIGYTDDVPGLKVSDKEIKGKYGCALSELVSKDDTVNVPRVGGRPSRSLQRQTLSEVIEPRYTELMGLVNQTIDTVQEKLREEGIKHHLAAGVVLTGGAAQIEGLVECAERVFRNQVRVGKPLEVSGLTDYVKEPYHSTAVGLLHYARDAGINDDTEYNEPSRSSVTGLFGRLRYWIPKEF